MKAVLTQILFVLASIGTLIVGLVGIVEIFREYGSIAGVLGVAASFFYLYILSNGWHSI